MAGHRRFVRTGLNPLQALPGSLQVGHEPPRVRGVAQGLTQPAHLTFQTVGQFASRTVSSPGVSVADEGKAAALRPALLCHPNTVHAILCVLSFLIRDVGEIVHLPSSFINLQMVHKTFGILDVGIDQFQHVLDGPRLFQGRQKPFHLWVYTG